MKPGRRPWRTSAYRVNWLTTSSSPPTSETERFVRPRVVLEVAQADEPIRHPIHDRGVVAGADPGQHHRPRSDLPDHLVADAHRRARDALHHEAHQRAAVVIGPASSPARGGASAASVKMARAFQIIQPEAPLSAAAAISAFTCAAVYGARAP